MIIEFIENYFSPITFFQSILMAAFLFSQKKGSVKQNRLLAFFLLSFGIMIGCRFVWRNPYFEPYRALLQVGLDFRFFIGPLFYLYLRSVFKPARPLKINDLLHGCIFLIVIVNQFTSQFLRFYTWRIYILFDLVQISVYIAWSFIEFDLVDLFIKPSCCKLDNRHIRWLRFFILSNFLTLLFLVFSWLVIQQVLQIPGWNSWFARVVGFTNFIFINTIVYIALKIPDAFISLKYKNSELPTEISERYKIRLIKYMENQRPYLNPTLSLNELAGALSISPKHLSQVINHSFQQNFYHYMNSYRIQVCKSRLLDASEKHLNILEIAFDSGFNSKNTFNAAFKKETGMTPTEFRKQQINRKSDLSP